MRENHKTQLLAAVLDCTPVGLAVVGADLRFRLVNPAYRALTPDPALDPVGRQYAEVCPADGGGQELEWVRQVLAGGEDLDGLRAVLEAPEEGSRGRSFMLHLRRLSGEPDPAVLITLSESSERDKTTFDAEPAGGAQRPPTRLHELDGRVRERTAELTHAKEELHAGESTLRMLQPINQDILSAQSSTAIAQASLWRIRQMIGCGWAAVVLFDIEAGTARASAVDADGPILLVAGALLPLAAYRRLLELGQGQVIEIADLAELAGQAEGPGMDAALNRPPAVPLDAALSPEGAHSYLAVPLTAGGQLVGALNLWRAGSGRGFEADKIDLARQAADSLAVAIHQAQLFEQVSAGRARLQEMSRRLVQAQEEERQAIARELHDEAGQSLTALMLGLAVLERDCECFTGEARARIAELKRTTDEVMEGLHRLSHNLRPASLDRLGLLPAIRQHIHYFEQETGVKVEFVPVRMDYGRLPPELETTLYRVMQEALTNIARHARASRARVVLKRRADRAMVIVEDNGAGFDLEAAQQSGRLGLLGMRERAELLGGRLTLESAPGRGTKVFAEIPV